MAPLVPSLRARPPGGRLPLALALALALGACNSGGESLAVRVRFSPAAPRVTVGQVVEISAIVDFSEDQRVTWSLVEGSAAGTVLDLFRSVAFAAGQAPGLYHLRAESVAYPGRYGMVEVVVLPVPSLQSLSASATTIRQGESAWLTATFADGTARLHASPGVPDRLGGGGSPMESGVPLELRPTGTTTYVLYLYDYRFSLEDPTPDSFEITVAVEGQPSGPFLASGFIGRRPQLLMTVLADGRVLATGDGLAEVYDPAVGRFTATAGPMVESRTGHAAALLADGRVLVVGGSAAPSAELYDPATDSFAATGPPAALRTGPRATLLLDGRVLVTGGAVPPELYEPATGTFRAALGSAVPFRNPHEAILLDGGRVLVCQAEAQLFDPITETFSRTGDMASPGAHGASRLADGTILVLGNRAGGYVAERYDPATGIFTLLQQLDPFADTAVSATILADGRILFAGGHHPVPGFVVPMASTDLARHWDPITKIRNVFTMGVSRYGHTAVALPSGKALLAGGWNRRFRPNSRTILSLTRGAEIFDPPPRVPVAVVISPTEAHLYVLSNFWIYALVLGVEQAGDIIWTVAEPDGGAMDGTQSAAVHYYSPALPGTYHVVATSRLDPTKSATSTIHVHPRTNVTVRVTPANATIPRGGTASFSAAVANAANPAVTWAAAEPVAGWPAPPIDQGTIDAAGLYQAPAAVGTYHVVARSVEDPVAIGVAEVVVY